MRKFFLILMAIGVSLTMIAGDKLSAPTKVFLQQRANAVAQAPDGKTVLALPKTVNGVECVDCFISLNGVSIAELEANGVKVTGKFSDFVTASIPINKIEAVARMNGVKQVGIARNARLLTDVAKGIVNADKAWDGTNYGLPQGYTGQGVVVGLIDDGIQFNHRAFLDDNGNTRVKAVYLPNVSDANGGTKATIDGVELMGYQYTTPSQIAVLTCDDTNQSHGTHTTGCAAGSHVGDYAGMAPEADLILCGCGSSLTENAIVSSAKYIGWYAQQLGKPCVISISLGSDIGPHDGTSITSRAYTEVANTYGAVILLAAGNEADIIGHAKKTLASNDDYIAVTNYVSAGWWGGSDDGACDIWNSTSDELQIKVIVNGSQSDWMTSGTFGDVTVSGGVNAFNNRYNLYIESSASSATYVVKGSAGNTINVYTDCSNSTLSSNSGTVSGYTITPGTYEGSMCDDMTSPKVISVGAQASRATDGYGQGDVAYFSSYGVDCNGVNQPFITAPGHYVISSVNGYNTYQSVTWSMTYNGQTYNWGEKSGTSMATPCAAGVVALYLQADPTLDVDRVKEVIAETATAYPLSSTSPVMARGHGIINALDGIEYILQHQGPTIIAKPDAVTIEGYQGETYTQVVKVKGYNLTGPITITKSGDAAYSVSHTTISAEDAYTGVDVTITYAPTAAGETTASLTLTSAEAETQTVNITGVAQPRVPTILVNPETLSFNAKLSTPATRTVKVNGLFLTNDITVTLNDQNNVFSVSPTTISKDNTGIDTPVAVNVTFNSDVEGDFTGSLTLTSNGAETKTVQLTAKATDKGMASDPYLDLAKYETIDEVGATVSGMSTIYKYTEYAVDECAWLTLSCYGALKADDTQNWYNTNSLSQYNNEWNATDVFLGDAAYFGSNNAYSIYGSGSQSFYVTGCIQVKAYVKGGGYSSSNATLSIYECSLNADGTLNPATTATSTQQGSNGVITSAELDASKIYKVQLAGGGSYPDLLEIGFKAELNGPGPLATAATDITASSFVANWNPCEGADSYILRVIPKNYDILTESFSKFTKSGVQEIGSLLDNYMDNAGWTGSKVYEAIGGARLGTGSSVGSLTSPGLDLTTSGGKVTVQFKAKAYNTDTNCGFKVSCGNASETVTVADGNEATYTMVLDCNAAAGQNVQFETTAKSKRVILTSIHIMEGDHAKAIRSIDFDGITIPGITGNSYKVINLDPGITYFYDVKAAIGDKETKWSNKIMVTTLAGGIVGDVNCDGEVTTVDITCLYNYLLNGDETYLATSDVDGDGFITTTDITVIYNILLGAK
ncbi:MAG: S8 family serine peptidase [Muribaculaceae bacterium]|nr:S8 family serine peptidase [Muribaculaceae bacterium]